MVTAIFANFAYGIIWAVLVVFAVRTLHLGAAAVGAVLAAGQFGGVVAAVSARRLANRFGLGPLMVTAAALLGPAWIVLGLSPRHSGGAVLALGWFAGSFAVVTMSVIGPSVRAASAVGLRAALLTGGAVSFLALPPMLRSPWPSLRELP